MGSSTSGYYTGDGIIHLWRQWYRRQSLKSWRHMYWRGRIRSQNTFIQDQLCASAGRNFVWWGHGSQKCGGRSRYWTWRELGWRRWQHRWELPVLHYHEIMVIYHYPFFEVITQLFSCIIFINDCICILTVSPGYYLFMIIYVIQKIGGNENLQILSM